MNRNFDPLAANPSQSSQSRVDVNQNLQGRTPSMQKQDAQRNLPLGKPFDASIKQIAEFITRNMPNILTWGHYFMQYDSYRDRIISDWEFQIMFPGLSSQVQKDISERNHEKARLRAGEIELQFLTTELDLSRLFPQIQRADLPQGSMYLSKPVSPAVEKALIQLSNHPKINLDSKRGFEEQFQNQQRVNSNALYRTMADLNIEINQTELIQLLAYFGPEISSVDFNKINFVQGMKPWIEKQRPQVSVGQGIARQSTMENQFDQNMAQQQSYGRQESSLYNNQGYNQQYQQPAQTNQGYNTLQQTPNQGFPPQGQTPTPLAQTYSQVQYQSPQTLAPPLNVNPNYPQSQTPIGMPPVQQNNDYNQSAFQTIVRQYGSDLDFIQNALRQRHSGVYKWFSTHSANSVSMWQPEFSKAIDALGAVQVSNQQRMGIFQSLDFNRQLQVQCTDIEALFKYNAQKEVPKIRKDDVLEQILRAFNIDDQFIENGLKTRQPLDLDSFVQFFEQFPQYKNYYIIDHITILGELYIGNRGLVQLEQFYQDLLRFRRERNMQKQPGFNGIQNEQRINSIDYPNHLMPSFSSDCTRSATQGNLQSPPYFRPPIDDLPVEEIMKGCYIVGKLVQDHFATYQNNQQNVLTMIDFTAAVTNLRSALMVNQIENLFREIDTVMNGNRPIGQLMPQQIDQYIHFVAKSNLQKLHENILRQIVDRVTVRNINLSAEFQRFDRGTYTVTFTQFSQIMQQLSMQIEENNLTFVTKKYSNGIDVQYVKFMDDLNQFVREKLAGSNNDLPGIIAEAIKKKLYVLNQDLTRFITLYSNQRFLSQLEFSNIFGQRLELVPNVCQESALINIFNQLAQNQGAVPTADIVRYFETKCVKHPNALKDALLTEITNKNINIRQIFEQNPDFSRYGRLTISGFVDVLVRNLYFTHLNAEFVAQFYTRLGDIDVNQFITDTTGSASVSQTKLKDVISRISASVQERQIQLAQNFGRYQLGSSRSSISRQDFFREIRQISNLSPAEEELIELTYANSMNKNEIDHIRFMEDLKSLNRQSATTSVQLTYDQQKLLKNVASMIEKEMLQKELVLGMRGFDTSGRGYLDQQTIKKVINDAIISKARPGQPSKGLSDNQISQILAACDTDSYNRFNYTQLLYELVGQTQVQKIIVDPNATTLTSPKLQAINKTFEIIGKQLQAQQQIVEAQINKMASSGKIKEEDFIMILKQMGISLSVDDRFEVQRWFQQNKDGQNLVNSSQLLAAFGITATQQTPTASSRVPKKILTDSELRACQDLINEIRRDIASRGMRPEQIIEGYRKSQADISMSPGSFMNALTSQCSEKTKQSLTKSAVSNLVHYLVKEEPGRVSFQKLYQALNLPESESPLRQDGVEDTKKYQDTLKRQINNSNVPFSIIELNQFMKRQGISLQQLFQLRSEALKGDILVKVFKESLQTNGYYPKDEAELIKSLQSTSTGTDKVSLATLQKHLKSLAPREQTNIGETQQKYGNMNSVVRAKIQQISDYMQRNNITTDQLHKTLDINNDGQVDKIEFVDGITNLTRPAVLTRQDLATIFDAIDINGDQFLSVNEFGLFLQGAKLKREQKIDRLDPNLREDIRKEVVILFQYFDKGKGTVNAQDIFSTMKALKQQITEERAKQMVDQVDVDKDGNINQQEFVQLMLPILLDELVSKEDRTEDIRAMFKEADTDYSGFLSIDEMYACMLKMGADVTKQEVIDLFTEFDINGDMQIDIDEFVAIMSFGEEINFQEGTNMATYMKIKKARKLNVLDFLKVFNDLPQSFIPSFYTERWQKLKKNLPSSVLKAQIDPRSMSWKDMMPVLTENLTPEQLKPENRPRLRPIPTTLGSQITIELAEGVPLPANSSTFDRQNIVKRVVRVGLFDNVKQDLIFNSAQIVASWNQGSEDIWEFNNGPSASNLNPIIFRTTQIDDLNKQDVFLVFELVVYVKNGAKTTEMSCGWSKVELASCERDLSKIKLDIKGGSPMSQIKIDDQDVRTTRSGIRGIMKMFNNQIKSTLVVSLKPMTSFEPETKVHLDLLPSTCLIQKKLLYFVSGYRNYAAETLLQQSAAGSLKKPSGDVIMSCFPKIMDSPDIVEVLAQVWTEDHFVTLNATQKRSIQLAMSKAQEFIQRIYPVLFSDGFAYQLSNTTESACGDPVKLALRKQLITSALRYNNPQAKSKASQPPSALTTFKPFNIREIEYDIWESESNQNQEIFTRKYDQTGVIGNQVI